MSEKVVRRPDPEPLETNDVRTVAVGTLAWAVGLVVLLVLSVTDAVQVRGWWLVMCGCGIALGLFGLRYVSRRQAALRTTADT